MYCAVPRRFCCDTVLMICFCIFCTHHHLQVFPGVLHCWSSFPFADGGVIIARIFETFQGFVHHHPSIPHNLFSSQLLDGFLGSIDLDGWDLGMLHGVLTSAINSLM